MSHKQIEKAIRLAEATLRDQLEYKALDKSCGCDDETLKEYDEKIKSLREQIKDLKEELGN